MEERIENIRTKGMLFRNQSPCFIKLTSTSIAQWLRSRKYLPKRAIDTYGNVIKILESKTIKFFIDQYLLWFRKLISLVIYSLVGPRFFNHGISSLETTLQTSLS